MIAALRDAEMKALRLVETAEQRGLIAAGKTEQQLSAEVLALAEEMFGIRKFWHKRIVRAGVNTLLPYDENPPDLPITEDDILFFDLGPVFEDWEADLGRTYVIGNDEQKQKLKADVETAWHEGKAWYDANPDVSGAELFAHMQLLARSFGWEFGGPIAGHIVGRFPHERMEGEDMSLYVHHDNHLSMQRCGKDGQPLHWILEVHFVDREAGIGAFFEQLMS